jgi:hypothetical protein
MGQVLHGSATTTEAIRRPNKITAKREAEIAASGLLPGRENPEAEPPRRATLPKKRPCVVAKGLERRLPPGARRARKPFIILPRLLHISFRVSLLM